MNVKLNIVWGRCASPGPKKVTYMTPKKSLPSSYPQKIYFAKKMAQKGHLWPQQWSEQSTAAYMGPRPPTR